MLRWSRKLGLLLLLAGFNASYAHADAGQLWDWASKQHGRVKHWIREEMAEPLAQGGLATAPPAAIWAGVSFDNGAWSPNEFTNQLGHMLVGGLTRDFFGRTSALVVAFGVEVQQYFVNDHRQLKLPDRLRDITFYLLP